MAIRMDNVGIVVADLTAAIDFFTDLGLELENRMTIEGGVVRAGHRGSPVSVSRSPCCVRPTATANSNSPATSNRT